MTCPYGTGVPYTGGQCPKDIRCDQCEHWHDEGETWVWVIMSELNGYKNIEGIAETKEGAYKRIDDMKTWRGYDRHHFYALEMKVTDKVL